MAFPKVNSAKASMFSTHCNGSKRCMLVFCAMRMDNGSSARDLTLEMMITLVVGINCAISCTKMPPNETPIRIGLGCLILSIMRWA